MFLFLFNADSFKTIEQNPARNLNPCKEQQTEFLLWKSLRKSLMHSHLSVSITIALMQRNIVILAASIGFFSTP